VLIKNIFINKESNKISCKIFFPYDEAKQFRPTLIEVNRENTDPKRYRVREHNY